MRSFSHSFAPLLFAMPMALGTGFAGRVEAAPTPVLVQSREVGQGMLFKRADTCYLLTAAHVVRGVDTATIVGSSEDRRYGEARIVARFEASDLALLRVTGGMTRDCGDELETYRADLSLQLARRPTGSLPFVFDGAAGGASGGIGYLPVVITDLGPEWLRVRPTRPVDTIEQGRSGSVVLIEDAQQFRAAGLLALVEPGGEGKVLRMDRAAALVARYFDNPASLGATAVVGAAPPDRRVVASPQAEVGNLLSLQAGAGVLAWNSLPSGPEFSPSNLVDATSVKSWNASAKSWPVELDFQLAQGKPRTLGRIEFVLARDQPGARAAREIEILSSLNGKSWRSIHNGTLFANEIVKSVSIAPLQATYLRLRIYQNWGDPHWVSLGRVRAYGQ